MGALFTAGSTMFLVPAVAALGSSADWIGVTFFCGSICFTTASLIQLVLASRVAHRGRPRAERERLRPRSWLPARVDWVSAVVQFPGTLLFNVNTFAALNTQLTTRQADVRVWAPDAIGSACFLISSAVAFAGAEKSWLSWRPRDPDWWITGLNLVGSIAFGVSAVAAFVRPETGSSVSDQVANGGTAVGALCFLVASLLLMREAERRAALGQ
jgi:hypothetical protein